MSSIAFPSSSRRVLSRLVIAAMPGVALPCAAADPGLETVVVTGSRAPEAARDVAASIRVLDQQELRRVRALHIADSLARVPGTWITRGNGQEHLTAIRSPVFTGPGSCGAFYFAEDGLRLRPSGVCNVNELAEVNYEQAERIEVLRGPGTAVHGGNAQHGVINVISMAPPSARTASVSVGGGANGYARLLASYGDGDADDAWRVSLNTTHDGGYKDASGYDLQKLSYRHDHQWSGLKLQSLLSLGNQNQETAGFVVGEDAYRDGDRLRENPNPEAFRDNRTARWYGRFTLDAAGSELALTPFWRHQRMRFLQHFLLGQPLEDNGFDSAGWQGEWRRPLGEQLELLAGADGEWSVSTLEQTQEHVVTTSRVLPAGKQYDYEVKGRNGALFAQLDWEPRAGTRLQAGARLEHQRYDYDNRMIDGATREDGTPCGSSAVPLPCRYSRPADRRDEFTEPAFHLGLVQEIGSAQRLSLGYAHGFRPPQSAELYRLQAGQLVADIDAERIDSIEAGWRADTDTLALALNAWAMRKDDVIFQDSERRNVDNAATVHHGIEYSLAWRFAPGWQLAADGTRALHRYDDDSPLQGLPPGTGIAGNEIDTAPRTMASVRLAWEPRDGTAIELEWQHMGRYFLEPTQSHAYDGHDLLHLRLEHRLSRQWGVSVRVQNLGDERYADRADYAFGEYRYFIGEPRSAFVDLDWQL